MAQIAYALISRWMTVVVEESSLRNRTHAQHCFVSCSVTCNYTEVTNQTNYITTRKNARISMRFCAYKAGARAFGALDEPRALRPRLVTLSTSLHTHQPFVYDTSIVGGMLHSRGRKHIYSFLLSFGFYFRRLLYSISR
jgi:hypothetical protein